MTAKRKQIPKKIRFEVFKRDSLLPACCGYAPDVLEIDHIIGVRGGDNKPAFIVF